MPEENYPSTINRAVVMVIPKKPLDDWEKSVFPDSFSVEDWEDECSAYLLKDSIMPNDPEKALKNDWEWIFENELFGICTNESTWPERRTWKMFMEWFDLKFSTIVLDLVDKPIIKED